MKPNRLIPTSILVIAAGCFIVPWMIARWRPAPKELPSFQWPFPELARLDSDLQARFAEVPTKEFGIERVGGPQHNLYVPTTAREKETVGLLKGKRTEVAFYLMSRSMWLRIWDGWGFKPIQGPVNLTGLPIKAPLPRAINYSPDLRSRMPRPGHPEEILTQFKGIETHLPDGTVVPAPTPPPGIPGPNQLQIIGNVLFESVEGRPQTSTVGIQQRAIKGNWNIVAVPIRASQPACLTCHRSGYPGPDVPDYAKVATEGYPTKVKVGDALGVAFYLYRQAAQPPAVQRARRAK